MTNQGMILGAVLGASLIVGCDDSSVVEEKIPDMSFRSNQQGLGDEDLAYPGNGDIEVRDGDDDYDIPDVIIWDLDGGNVARQEQDGAFKDLLAVGDDEVLPVEEDALDEEMCTAVEGNHPSGEVFKFVHADGTVALTVWQRFVFIGDADVPTDPVAQVDFVEANVAFTFDAEKIYAGSDWEGQVVAHASAEIDEASPMRRLLLGALVTGECGSDGLP